MKIFFAPKFTSIFRQILRHDDSNLVLVIMIISFHPGVLLFPPKQEVDTTSAGQNGYDSLFYCVGS